MERGGRWEQVAVAAGRVGSGRGRDCCYVVYVSLFYDGNTREDEE